MKECDYYYVIDLLYLTINALGNENIYIFSF